MDDDDGLGAGAELCDGLVGRGSEGNGNDGSEGAGFDADDGAGAELCWVGSGSGRDGKGKEGSGSGSGSEEPDDEEELGSGGNNPAKAGAPLSIRASVPAATVPARRAALLGIVGVPPGRLLEIANEPLPGK